MKKYKIYIKTGKIEKLDHQFDITELENALDFLIIEQQIIELIVIESSSLFCEIDKVIDERISIGEIGKLFDKVVAIKCLKSSIVFVSIIVINKFLLI